MDIRYVNHNGDKADLMKGVYKIQESSLFSHSWNYDSDDATTGYGGKIKKFRKGVQNKEVVIHIEGAGMESYKQAYDHLMELFDEDIISETAGRLYIDDFYMRCFITDGEPVYFVPGLDMCTYKFKIASDYSFWIHEESRSFPPILPGAGQEAYLDYEYDYNYDYTMPYGGDVIWKVDHFAPCEYEMVIYGPCVDPRIVINGHIYQVFDTLDENEYIKINSRENTVVKYMANGIQKDLYDYRIKVEGSLFTPITPGNIRIVWPGNFGFDLTLFCERSEPKWKMKDS